MYKIYKTISVILSAFIAVLGLSSCNKTEYEYLKRPYNEIKQFTISGSNGETTKCLISGDLIMVYWNPDSQVPETITPTIIIDEKAKISPESGKAVPLNEKTVYTVTAENGEVKTYRINLSLKIPVPSISNVPGQLIWASNTQFNIFGEYFLANTQASEIKAYLQRVSDGFEFPVELVTSKTTNYALVANLPKFSTELDTGMHKLFVKAGNRVAKGVDIRFTTPLISNANPVSNLVQEGKAVHSGDELTINYSLSDNYGGKAASYYHAKNIDYVLVYFDKNYDVIEVKDFVAADNTVKIKLPNVDEFIGQGIAQYRFIYKFAPAPASTNSSYFLRGYVNTKTPVEAKK